MYPIERIILVSAWVMSFISILFIPRKKIPQASFIFVSTQFFTWILGLFAVEFACLDYPVRELSKANATSFSFEYFILPIITIFFILNYPYSKPLKARILYYFIFSSAFTLLEYFLERYTLVIKYNSWRWYWTWISMSLVFYFEMIIYKWFFRIKRIFSI
ncbi:MAG: hypothetical protein K0R50_4104 [Eubacterium sp.]|jgi:hypothetical protein|nr:hypothetical protein [Eubacterium sp.]